MAMDRIGDASLVIAVSGVAGGPRRLENGQ